MPCHYPAPAYRLRSGEIVFDLKRGYDVTANLKLPCGQCTGCMIDRSRQWALRCMHEAQLHKQNCFVTLTYNNENLPDELNYSHFQKFMKDLRNENRGKRIRFYMCGEYGEQRQRPHFHVILFNYEFPDKKFFNTSKSGYKTYTSQILDDLWGKGFTILGTVNFESAAYTARYIMKKANGKDKTAYEMLDLETGELSYKEKEFSHMSLKPGIGSGWYDKYKSEVFPLDRCVINGAEIKPPKYYTRKLKEEDPELYEEIQFNRAITALKKSEDNTDDRLLVKEEVLKAKIRSLTRCLK